jgi:hypothetical protein
MMEQQRAIEALRSGVPSREAVRVLGSTQPAIEQRFDLNLAAVEGGERPGGFLIRGGFGAGKSHLLECMRHRAEAANFVTSRVIVGKQTPLHDPAKVFRAALEGARVPGYRGEAIEVITSRLDYTTPAYGEFLAWVHDPRNGLNDRFGASLYLFENLDDLEFSDVIRRFWSGETIRVSDLRRKLRDCGQATTYQFPPIPARELAVQRFRFLARLIQAAGFAGWVLLFDEVEIVAQYSLLQRGRSYAEIARWAEAAGGPIDGVTSVLAITTEFAHVVLDEKRDLDDVPNKFQQRGTPVDLETARLAEIGMRLIKEPLPLSDHDDAARRRVYETLRHLHGIAYGWEPPDVPDPRALGARPIREYIRAWIHSWDLRRLDPSYTPEIEVETVHVGLEEDADMGGEEGDGAVGGWEDAGH